MTSQQIEGPPPSALRRMTTHGCLGLDTSNGRWHFRPAAGHLEAFAP